MGRRKWVLAAAGATAALTVGFGVVMAQSGEDGTGTSFLDRVAAKLGIGTPALEQAIQDARSEELDEAVADGDLTQEQADRLRERLDELPGEGLGGGFGFRFGLKEGGFAFKFAEVGPGFAISAGLDNDELAEFLGISVEQLGEELQAGEATLASVAEAHGKSRDELKAFIEGEAKTRLDEAVAEGDLAQERADAVLENLRGHIDSLIDKQLPWAGKHGPFFHGGPFRFHDEPHFDQDDDATPEEQSGELEPASRS